MGLLGRNIDALPPGARDRVLEAQGWCIGRPANYQGDRCLVGHVEDWTDPRCPMARDLYDDRKEYWPGVPEHFDAAVCRFGLDRVVHAIKLRAAKENRIPVEPTPVEATP